MASRQVRMVTYNLDDADVMPEAMEGTFATAAQAHASFKQLVAELVPIFAKYDALGACRLVTITHRDADGKIFESWTGTAGLLGEVGHA